MSHSHESPNDPSSSGRRASRKRTIAKWLIFTLLFWGAVAYLLLPWVSKRYFEHEDKDHRSNYEEVSRITKTADDHPGDPINLALVGEETALIRAMTTAGWYPADPITFDSSVRIAVDSVFHRPDDKAPVSNLFLYGRKQDLAFEQAIGDSPAKRHHVRFWRGDKTDGESPVWFGSATLDERVGLSYATGQITHHIGPDVDAERDRILSGLQEKGWVKEVRWRERFHVEQEGRNGGGDLWKTDGRLAIGILLGAPVDPSKAGE